MANGPVALGDTCLCAIVRDEVINPAGGILDFIDSTMPYVETAVIVDTGSIDGTRELLEEAKLRYTNLEVRDHEFKGFADARNYSVSQAKSKRVLVLDADERITPLDITALGLITRHIASYSSGAPLGHSLPLLEIAYEGTTRKASLGAHSVRFFDKSAFSYYENHVWEQPTFSRGIQINQIAEVSIRHFLPPAKALNRKVNEFYESVQRQEYFGPSSFEGFKNWKQINPHREKHR